MAHKPYLQVQRGQGRHQVRLPGREAEPAADTPDHQRTEGIVGDEEDPTFELTAGNGFGHVVQQGGETEALYAVYFYARAHPVLLKLALDAADDLEDVIQGVQVMVRASFQLSGEGEFGDESVEEPRGIQWGFEGRAEIQEF
jgi:hypothetical protein